MHKSQLQESNAVISSDARQHMLHILPVLQVDPFDKIAVGDITLSVRVSWLEEPILPENSEWVIHQPYPNNHYFVGGSPDCHLGYFISLPAGQQTGEVTLCWTVRGSDLPPGQFYITHRQDLTFSSKQGHGNIWSMDIANWWAHSEFATEGHPEPEIGRNRTSRISTQRLSPTRRAQVDEELRSGCRYVDIQESITLPRIPLADCWTVETYGGDTALDYLETLR